MKVSPQTKCWILLLFSSLLLTTVSSNLNADTVKYVKNCDDSVPLVTCERNQCATSTCLAYPTAECRLDLCDTCKPIYFVRGVKVNCTFIGRHRVDTRQCAPEDLITCYDNPCVNAACGGYPKAECRINTCGTCKTSFFINEQPITCSDTITNPSTETTTVSPIQISHKIEDECPLGVPVVNCVDDPCAGRVCDAYGNAECRVSLCGECKAVFYVNDKPVNCNFNNVGHARISSCEREKKRGDLSTKPYRFVVKCKPSGDYESLQCWPTVGLCWCVNKRGRELLGSRMYFPWKPNCEKIALDCRSKEFGCCPDNITPAKGLHFKGCPDIDYDKCGKTLYGCCRDGKSVAKGPRGEGCPREQTKCELSQSQNQLNPNVRFRYKCDADGLYLTIQCLENLGICWCVDSDGREREGTRTNGRPDCTAAVCEDKRADCMVYARVPGFCQKISHYMKEYCRKSCRFCSPQKSASVLQAYNPARPGCDSVYGCCKDMITPAKGLHDYLCPLYVSTCHMPKVQGECDGSFERYYYDMESNQCKSFTYSGCRGNENNFVSRIECENDCLEEPETSTPDRYLGPKGPKGGQDGINVTLLELGKVSKSDESVKKGLFSPGCNSKYGCCDDGVTPATGPSHHDCPKFDSICHMPAATGPCNEYLTRYFFNTKTRNCDAFVYGGCYGNKNTFVTRGECAKICIYNGKNGNEVDKTTATDDDVIDDESSGNSVESVLSGKENINRIESNVRRTKRPTDVNENPNVVRPSKPTIRYDDEENNQNENRDKKKNEKKTKKRGRNFDKLMECEKRLQISEEINANIMTEKDRVHHPNCTYSGGFTNVQCWPNQGYCWCVDRDGNEVEGTKSSRTPACPKSTSGQPACVDSNKKKCATYGNSLYCQRYKTFMKRTCPETCGYCPDVVARPGCKSKFGCCDDGLTPKLSKDSTCPRYGDICYMPANQGKCLGYMERWYYDSASQRCVEFTYGGCDGNQNNFLTKQECEYRCNYDVVQRKLLMITKPRVTSSSKTPSTLRSTSTSSTTDTTTLKTTSTPSTSSRVRNTTLPTTVTVDNTPTPEHTSTEQYSTEITTEEVVTQPATDDGNVIEDLATTPVVDLDNSVDVVTTAPSVATSTTTTTATTTSAKTTAATTTTTTTQPLEATTFTDTLDVAFLTDPTALPKTTSKSTTLPKTTIEATTLPKTTIEATTLQKTTIEATTLPKTTAEATTLPNTTTQPTTLRVSTTVASTLYVETRPKTERVETTSMPQINSTDNPKVQTSKNNISGSVADTTTMKPNMTSLHNVSSPANKTIERTNSTLAQSQRDGVKNNTIIITPVGIPMGNNSASSMMSSVAPTTSQTTRKSPSKTKTKPKDLTPLDKDKVRTVPGSTVTTVTVGEYSSTTQSPSSPEYSFAPEETNPEERLPDFTTTIATMPDDDKKDTSKLRTDIINRTTPTVTSKTMTSSLNEACMAKPDRGDCDLYLPRYYYNATMKQCILFSYTGCKGNGNNFQTKLECMNKCLLKDDEETTSVTTMAPNTLGCNSVYGCCDDRVYPAKGPNGEGCPKYNNSCEMPRHQGPCRALITRWYYDKKDETCKTFTWGGCDGNNNNYATDIDCYVACDSKYINPTDERTTDETEEDVEVVLYPGCTISPWGCCKDGVSIPEGPDQKGCPEYESLCDMPKVSGTCKERLVRYYYDSKEQKCDNFLFSGCGGNQNNFDTLGKCHEQCENVRSTCNDLYSLCSAWKDRGFCKTSPDIGGVYCKRTCGKCRDNRF